MTDNEIIKALECCLSYSCLSCPCEKGASILCLDDLHRYALDLINRQKSEIERLEKDSKRLKKVQMQLDDAMKMYTTIKAEAIKEFAERLKKSSSYSVVADGDREIPSTRRYSISESNIDNLVKEMVGEG